MTRNLKGYLLGVVTISTFSCLGLLSLAFETASLIGPLMWGSLFLGGLVTSAYAETQKVLLALLLALPAALIFAVANSLWAIVIGPTDFPGFVGFVTVFGSTLVLGAILCVLGGTLGFAITRNGDVSVQKTLSDANTDHSAQRMNNPDLFVVIWNGEMLEGEWPDAITFSQADAEAFIARSPGRKQSYEIMVSPMLILLGAAPYCLHSDQVQRQLAEGNRAPITLRDEAHRAYRAR